MLKILKHFLPWYTKKANYTIIAVFLLEHIADIQIFSNCFSQILNYQFWVVFFMLKRLQEQIGSILKIEQNIIRDPLQIKALRSLFVQSDENFGLLEHLIQIA